MSSKNWQTSKRPDFPTPELLDIWIKSIKQPQHSSRLDSLVKYLPNTDSNWHNRMHDVFDRVRLKYSHSETADLSVITAEIFYNINKIHSEIDSNKRSSIICIFLFILMNVAPLPKIFSKDGADEVYKMAKTIAKSKGNKFRNTHIRRQAEKFKDLFSPL